MGLLMLVWAFSSHHCYLEKVSGLEFLRCPGEAHDSGDGSDHCNDTGCCALEHAQYHATRHSELMPIGSLISYLPEHVESIDLSLPIDVRLGILTASPPEILSCWRFLYRTALPVRAPSLVS